MFIKNYQSSCSFSFQPPIRKHDEKFVGMCCCESGPLSITLDVPFSGFVSGQYIPVSVEIENMTTRSVTASNCLLRKVQKYVYFLFLFHRENIIGNFVCRLSHLKLLVQARKQENQKLQSQMLGWAFWELIHQIIIQKIFWYQRSRRLI